MAHLAPALSSSDLSGPAASSPSHDPWHWLDCPPDATIVTEHPLPEGLDLLLISQLLGFDSEPRKA